MPVHYLVTQQEIDRIIKLENNSPEGTIPKHIELYENSSYQINLKTNSLLEIHLPGDKKICIDVQKLYSENEEDNECDEEKLKKEIHITIQNPLEELIDVEDVERGETYSFSDFIKVSL